MRYNTSGRGNSHQEAFFLLFFLTPCMPGPDQRHISACDGDISWQCTAGWSGSERFRELLVLFFFFSSSPLKSTFIIVHYWFISSNSLKEATAATPIGDETPLCILHPDLGLGVRDFCHAHKLKKKVSILAVTLEKKLGTRFTPCRMATQLLLGRTQKTAASNSLPQKVTQ